MPQILRFPDAADQELAEIPRSRSRRLLLKLALKYGRLPTLLLLKGVYCTDSESRGSGGFADVFSGSFNNSPVALKHLRTFATATEDQKLRMRQVRFFGPPIESQD